jgi:polyhydroxybutyrate depolymerase
MILNSQKSILPIILLSIISTSLLDCRNRRRNIPMEFKDSFVEIPVVGTSLERSVFFYYPEESKNTPSKIPLILIYHGGGGSPEGMVGLDNGRLLEFARERKYAVAYMRGYKNSWNDLREDNNAPANRDQHEDILYTKLFLDQIQNSYKIDSNRVFAGGISNGGMFSLRLACEMPEKFVAITAITANLPTTAKDVCIPKKGTNLTIINGSSDPIVPYDGGEVTLFGKSRGKIYSTDETIQHFKNIYSCGSVKTKIIPKSNEEDPTQASLSSWRCNTGSLYLIKINQGGHSWPGGVAYLPKSLIGLTSNQFSASKLIADLVQSNGKISESNLKP